MMFVLRWQSYTGKGAGGERVELVQKKLHSPTLSSLIDVPLRLFFGEKNSGASALFEGGTFNENPNENPMVILVLKAILFKIQF